MRYDRSKAVLEQRSGQKSDGTSGEALRSAGCRVQRGRRDAVCAGVGITLALLSISTVYPEIARAQSVPGFDIEVYSTVIDPVRLAFGADGELFAGRDPALTGSGTSLKIHRVDPDHSYAEYGNSAIPDPDAPVYDANGTVSGVPGSVLVGGIVSGSTGRISAIHPDGAVVSLFQSTAITNPSEFKFDSTGRLVFVENGTRRVFTTSGGTPVPICTISGSGAPGYLALDAADRIYTSSSDGKIRIHASDGTLINDAFATFSGYASIELGTGGAFGTDLYAVEASSGTLYRVNSAGIVTSIGTGFSGGDLAFGPDGNLYVAEQARDRVLRIVPQSSGVLDTADARIARVNAFPNPFSDEVTLTYQSPGDAPAGVTSGLAIYDSGGRLVRVLDIGGTSLDLDGHASSNASTWIWDGKDADGRAVAAGVFYLRPVGMETKSMSRLIRMR